MARSVDSDPREGSEDEMIHEVPTDDDHKLFEYSLEIVDRRKEETRIRGGRVIIRPTYLYDYGTYVYFD